MDGSGSSSNAVPEFGEGGSERGKLLRLEGVRELVRGCRDLLVSSSLLGPVDPSFRALSGRLEFTVRRHKFNKDSLSRANIAQRFTQGRRRPHRRRL